MKSSLRFGTAIAAIATSSLLGGCALPGLGRGVAASQPAPTAGYAIRAQLALEAGRPHEAVGLAEQAVAANPRSSELRALLGNAYLSGGRYVSAESAYRDSIALSANQPKVVLKLALVQTALGYKDDATRLLDQYRELIDPADYGLAMALAGRIGEAVEVLEITARLPAADARVRQNLALSYALAGNWTQARRVAEQDLPLDQVDGRLQQWMTLAKPMRASDQVASLIGVAPVADSGMPVRLALTQSPARSVAIAVAAPAPAPEPASRAAAVQPITQLAAIAAPKPAPAPVSAQAAPVRVAASAAPAPVQREAAPAPQPAPATVAEFTPAPSQAVEPALADLFSKAAAPVAAPAIKRASLKRATRPANASVVVQLGAFGSLSRVAKAWSDSLKRYSSLRSYSPVRGQIRRPDGTLYRLSVSGFGSHREAVQLCRSLRASGGKCFVRSVGGDSPVQFASR